MGFSKARPGIASTLDLARNVLEAAYIIEDGVGTAGELIYWAPWDVDTAPSAAEALIVIHSLEGDWPHIPQEAPGPIGGIHLTAIGARMLTARQRYLVHAPISAGQKLDHVIESLDTVASNGRSGATFYYSNRPPQTEQIYRKFTRETAVTAAGETVLAATVPLTLPGAKLIIELIGIMVPDGTLTADIEAAGRFIVRADGISPVNEVSWDVDPWEAMEATSGVMGQGQLWRQECDLVCTVPAVVLNTSFDLDVAQTTQTTLAAIGASYLKSIPTTNPLGR
jgi:hypothetical protein